jgi:hypothetical protein
MDYIQQKELNDRFEVTTVVVTKRPVLEELIF